MTVREALAAGAAALAAGAAVETEAHVGALPLDADCRGSRSPWLDASLLLALAVGVDRSRLLAMGPETLPGGAMARFRELLQRRQAGEPVAYLAGVKEFYGRPFLVDRRVLVPRPETELLVEAVLRRLPPARPAQPNLGGPDVVRVHDAFSGSGCVGLTLAAERPDLAVSLSDISGDALAVCRANAVALLGYLPEIRQGQGLSAAADMAAADLAAWPGDRAAGFEGWFDCICANPPYVDSAFTAGLLAAGGREPRLALDGGPDGLVFYKPLAIDGLGLLRQGGWLALEIGDDQGAAVRSIMEAAGFGRVAVLRDLAGHHRVVVGARP